MSKSILVMTKRHHHLHSIAQKPSNPLFHEDRLSFELSQKDSEALAGAIADYLIADVEQSHDKRLYIIAKAADYLSDDWLLLLYEGLFIPFTAISPIINSQWSVLTKDVQGHFHFINKTTH